MSETPLLLPHERIDDLQFMNLRIIQSPDAFCFGMDAVLLADFARARANNRCCDLGTGTGILPLLIYGRERTVTFDAVEIQTDAADRARRSVLLNRLQDRIKVHAGDLRNIRNILPHSAYDLVVCNPPYSPQAASLPSPRDAIRPARQEGACTLADVADAAKWLLRHHGRLCLMLPAQRLPEAFDTLRQRKLEPKRLRLAHARIDRPSRLAFIEALLYARPGLSVEPPLITHNADGAESDEVKRIYHLL